MEEASQKKDEFLKNELEGAPAKFNKEALVDLMKEKWYHSSRLRMAITGRKVQEVEQNGSTNKEQTA